MNDTNIALGFLPDTPEEKEIARLTDELAEWERWATAVLTDFKIPFDNHKVGMRMAFTRWMAENYE